mmetsp:Transcript_7376/g.18046  ORF Transcript_7376/g.18046 Transcript_7376/m.18046 type:complete len:94 (+) Transcript_7376:1007-1288(+)
MKIEKKWNLRLEQCAMIQFVDSKRKIAPWRNRTTNFCKELRRDSGKEKDFDRIANFDTLCNHPITALSVHFTYLQRFIWRDRKAFCCAFEGEK